MEIISTEIFDFNPIESENCGNVYINGQKTQLTLIGEKLETCVKVEKYYVACITYYRGVEDESKRLAIYLIDQHHSLLDSKEIFGNAITYMFGEDVDDRFYGLELKEPNTIFFDFVYTNQFRLIVCSKKTDFHSYLKLTRVRNIQRERIMGRSTKYRVFGHIGYQFVVINKFDNDVSRVPKLTLNTPYYNGVFSDKSQVFADNQYTHLTLNGTVLKNIIKIGNYYLFVISTIINNYRWDNLHLVTLDFNLVESVKINSADRIKIIIDAQSQQDNSFILDYTRQDQPVKQENTKILTRHQLRCWITQKKSDRYLWLPISLSFLRYGIHRNIGVKSHFHFEKIKSYKEYLT